MVDGAPREGTVCTLSHWPGTPTPPALWADLSAEIVLRALAGSRVLPEGVDAVSVDHEDADGVISLALLCVEGLAASHAGVLVEAARAGDFGVVTDRHAALVAFALEAALGSSSGSGRPLTPGSGTEEALRVLPELVADPASHEPLWRDQAAAFDASREALTEGSAVVDERLEHDLAVVRLDDSRPPADRAAWAGAPLHRAAVHSATGCLRVATIAGKRFELRYRYESWVRLVSRRPRPRVDLSAAAKELSDAEPDGARWVFDGAGAVTPALRVAGGQPSGLDAEAFVEVVCRHLDELDRRGEPAWDPYR